MDYQKKVLIIAGAVLISILLLNSLGFNITGEAKGGLRGKAANLCNDHIDNDGDGFCDYSWRKARCDDGSIVGDIGCKDKKDNDEADCGDGICSNSEDKFNCIVDCYVCGDNVCDAQQEGIDSCPVDCAYCGDGVCNLEESCSSCTDDCGTCPTYCGDNSCNGNETCSTCFNDCGTCPILKPDLIVSQFNLNTTKFYAGEPFYMKVYVKNIGNAVAKGSNDLVLRLIKNGEFVVEVPSIQDIDPGEEQLYISHSAVSNAGNYEFIAYIDWNEIVNELDENNNKLSKKIIVSN